MAAVRSLLVVFERARRSPIAWSRLAASMSIRFGEPRTLVISRRQQGLDSDPGAGWRSIRAGFRLASVSAAYQPAVQAVGRS